MATGLVVSRVGLVAREHQVTAALLDYDHRIGGHCGSGAMRDLLEWAGLGWDGPPTEGLVFALGGTLDFAYARSSELRPAIYLVGRGGDFELDLPRRLGASVEAKSTDDPIVGWDWVTSEIDAGRPVMVWADIAELPYLNVRLRMSRHDIVVVGYNDDTGTAYVVDNDRKDVQEVPYDALARARSSTSFPVPTRHTTYLIDWPEKLPALLPAAAAALIQSANNMRVGGGGSIAAPNTSAASGRGLSGIEVFATDVALWEEIFDEKALDQVLKGLAAFVEKAGTGGGLFRRLMSDGCSEIADHTGNPVAAAAAKAADRCANAWTEVAIAAAGLDPTTSTVHERAEAAATAASRLPELEAQLVVALESGTRA